MILQGGAVKGPFTTKNIKKTSNENSIYQKNLNYMSRTFFVSNQMLIFVNSF